MSGAIRIMPQSDYNNGLIASLMFDAVTEFTPTEEKSVTQYRTTASLPFSNNTVTSNPTINMRGRVSTCPVMPRLFNLIDEVEAGELAGRVSNAHDILKSWFDQDLSLFIDVGYRGFSEYQLISFSPVEDGTDSLIFDLRFEKVRRVTYERIVLIQHMTPELTKDAASKSTDGKTKTTSTERTSQVTEALRDSSLYFKQNGNEALANVVDGIGKIYDDEYDPSNKTTNP